MTCPRLFQLSKVMKKVRHRLAACQTVREDEDFSELPGGIWKVSPTRDVRLTSLISAMSVLLHEVLKIICYITENRQENNRR